MRAEEEMDFIPVVPVKKALNKAYLRRPVERAELLRFMKALHQLFDDLDETESEEHCKNLFADSEDRYLTNTAYAIGSSELYLLGVLNSKLFWFMIGRISIPFGTRDDEYRYRLIYQYMEQIPIVERKAAEADPARSSLPVRIESHVGTILEKKKADPSADVAALEAEIDGLVYLLYGLTEEEIAVVEGQGSRQKPQQIVGS